MLEINKVYNMDCREGIKLLPDNSVDLVITDPPYFKVLTTDWKGDKYEWDNQWDTFNDYIEWCKTWFVELKRVLKPSGSLYMFADNKRAAYLQIELDKLFHLENNLIWFKLTFPANHGWKNSNRYVSNTEQILFYSNQIPGFLNDPFLSADYIKHFAPIIEYLISQKELIKKHFNFKTNKEFHDYLKSKIKEGVTTITRHYFEYDQWTMPTREHYEELQSISPNFFKKSYNTLKEQYDEIKNRHTKVFMPKQNYHTVWRFNVASIHEKTYHPTQKPLPLIHRMIKTSSREGQLVLDCFMGSGTTAVAAKQLGRNFIGFEKSKKYVNICNLRLSQKTLSFDSYTNKK